MEISKNILLIAIIGPFITTILAIILLFPSFIDLLVLLLMYLVTGFGITVGYHRLLTHNSFKTSNIVRYLFAIAGSMAVEGTPINWVADHRKHHKYSDKDDDPHSPHKYNNVFKALYHSHVGWLLEDREIPEPEVYCRDLCNDFGMVLISKYNPEIIVIGLLIPMFIALILGGNILTALIWGGFVRIFLIHHVTWAVNSICHYYGKRPHKTYDKSTNVSWLAIPSLGESWHNNHHAYPCSAAHGNINTQLDLSYLLIILLERMGLAWDIKLPKQKKSF